MKKLRYLNNYGTPEVPYFFYLKRKLKSVPFLVADCDFSDIIMAADSALQMLKPQKSKVNLQYSMQQQYSAFKLQMEVLFQQHNDWCFIGKS